MTDFKKIGGVGIMGYVSPLTTDDEYPVIDPLYGIDGLRNEKTIENMVKIPVERRRAGMVVGIDGGERYFKLKNIRWIGDLSDWEEIFFQTVSSHNLKYIDKEKPIGDIDNVNNIFELSFKPIPNSEHVFLNGLLQDANEDYILDGKKIIFYFPPMVESKIRCTYRAI